MEETVLPEEDTNPPLNLDEEAFSPTLGETTSSPPILELESDLGKEDTAVKTEQAKDEPTTVTTLQEEIANLTQEKSNLIAEIEQLEQQKKQIIAQQTAELQNSLQNMIQMANANLEERQQALQVSIEQLERRRERIKQEMRTTFAGASQELAVRVQGFKDYLVGSLQDLATAAEQLKLPTYQAKPTPPPANLRQSNRQRSPQEQNLQPEFANNQKFQDQSQRIRDLLDRYRTRPDYYGRPWQLRRTFEPIHAEKVRQWFFSQGGRGSIKTMGSRLQNILVASTIISVLHMLYGSRCRSLILADTPERLGEWRRGLQDCLGISRTDFGPNRGITLFESAEALIQKAERLQAEKLLPLIIIDETEENINLGLLQFPLWLAFAPDPKQAANYNYMY
ncbi:MAG: DUF3086 domain-containing protein [Cyanobacteria bacterium J083]|nr:MAG: DUF3086 domain-containing protein [Cyanobacteria bacterium J083]